MTFLIDTLAVLATAYGVLLVGVVLWLAVAVLGLALCRIAGIADADLNAVEWEADRAD